ncbi:TraR/DksA C4-type zinc finger protein [Maricaulis sp.]|uniref:TraR/DksA family transcriptional regulator n=1 Tax=Maricaulis sp. TaxID=1486257 RepID=UPI00260CAC96|nr:TraR/DksA C4-type zinc finger protein [Maricaulis sp.]
MGTDAENVRERLTALKAELLELSRSGREDRRPVELDQQSVGRLSRQDSLQVQAMAQAADVRRLQEVRRIDAALQRLDDGEYGWCTECGEAIEARRLEIDPASPRCAGCA